MSSGPVHKLALAFRRDRRVNHGVSSAEASAATGVNLASATIQFVVNHSSFISRESQKAAGAECTASPRSR